VRHFLPATIISVILCQALLAGQEARTTTLTVEVVNETVNGTAVTGDAVIVQLYEQGELLRTLEGAVAADGKVVFENIPAGDKIVALPRSRHDEMMFSGSPVALKPAEDGHSAQVQVFDTSDDKSKISVQTHHFIVKNTPDALVFTEYMQLVNSSSMAVSSKEEDARGRAVVLEIELPKGFKGLESLGYFEQDALVVTDEGFYDTMAVPPGEHQVMFSYALDKTSGAIDVVKGITLPTSKLVVFAELGQASLQGLGESKSQAMGPDGAEIRYYTRDNLKPGEKIAFRITGLSVENSGATTWVVLAAAFGAVMILVVLRLRASKSRP